ncbi:Protein NATD1 [Pseudolycoriella hygida]|uniref:Protein NATD1 n=1 Tax=Pseudolycoriella hygida TaxID=35572 RepID=A0A9Q0MY04_9DIPT|nr:Protein NATD1 [Pseudolycoriella hygida]
MFGSVFRQSILRSNLSHSSKLIAPTMYTKSQVKQFTSAISTESVQHDQKNSNFYVTLGDHKAFIEYSLAGNVMKLNHTVVPEIFGGRGVGKVLAEAVLDHCKQEGLQAELICDFIQHYYEKYGSKYESIIVKN